VNLYFLDETIFYRGMGVIVSWFPGFEIVASDHHTGGDHNFKEV
jgi:hypothetical protein